MINYKSVILKDHEDARLKNFFQKVLDQLANELKLLAEFIYQYPNGLKGIDDKESVNDVFALTEVTYVGLLNNAIVKTYKNAVTLQEFGVYKERISFGRADLFVSVPDETASLDLLFEAKAGVADGKNYSNDDTKEYYRLIYNQARNYYIAEEKYYRQKPHIVTITFEWVRHKDLLDDILKEDYSDECTDFYYIYHTNEAGLLVYGSYNELVDYATINIPTSAQ